MPIQDLINHAYKQSPEEVKLTYLPPFHECKNAEICIAVRQRLDNISTFQAVTTDARLVSHSATKDLRNAARKQLKKDFAGDLETVLQEHPRWRSELEPQ